MADLVHVSADNSDPSTSTAVTLPQQLETSQSLSSAFIDLHGTRRGPASSLAVGGAITFNGYQGPVHSHGAVLSPYANSFVPGPSNSTVGPRVASSLPDKPAATAASRPVVSGLKPSIVGVKDGANARPFTDESDALTRYLLIKGATFCVDRILEDANYVGQARLQPVEHN